MKHLAIIKPLYDKPKSKNKRQIIDYAVHCPKCNMFICYPTEHNAKDDYKFCTRCGIPIYWNNNYET